MKAKILAEDKKIELSEELTNYLEFHAKHQGISLSHLILNALQEKLEDMEDEILGQQAYEEYESSKKAGTLELVSWEEVQKSIKD